MARAFEVLIHGVIAGSLTESDMGRVAFRFYDSYRELVRRPVLGQAFEDDLYRTYPGKNRELPPFFANLVPEGQLRELIEHSAGVAHGDDLALLATVGSDLPGAVELRLTSEQLAMAQVDDEEPSPPPPDVAHEEPALRFSLAGVQLKFSVLREHEKLALPAHDKRGAWIVKLDSAKFPRLVENEFATLEWARAAGFNVPECHLQSVGTLPDPLQQYAISDTNVLLIRRYDRNVDARVHQEDFAQVVNFPPRLKYHHISYEQCAVLVREIVGREGYFEFVRRLAFVIATGNVDAHLKNWSLLYPDAVNATLSPLYDQVCTIAWPGLKPELALKLAGAKPLLRVTREVINRFARRAGMDERDTLTTFEDAVARTAEAWLTSRAADVMPRQHIASLRTYWTRAPLLRHASGELFRVPGTGAAVG